MAALTGMRMTTNLQHLATVGNPMIQYQKQRAMRGKQSQKDEEDRCGRPCAVLVTEGGNAFKVKHDVLVTASRHCHLFLMRDKA